MQPQPAASKPAGLNEEKTPLTKWLLMHLVPSTFRGPACCAMARDLAAGVGGAVKRTQRTLLDVPLPTWPASQAKHLALHAQAAGLAAGGGGAYKAEKPAQSEAA